ncbi:MAG: arginine repressor [Defluviitaleaceae bacterium]|nr:arginine repressor [Defluviitaleaceae bacterium]
MKNKRHALIIDLIVKNEVETQSDLTRLLSEAGLVVTQSTVSRDISQLRLVKVPADNGSYKYAVPVELDKNEKERLNRLYRTGLESMDCAGNIVVLRTMKGAANVVAAALDAMRFDEVLGTVAGDDVVICVVRSEKQALELTGKLSC